jgi:hypothetical protein
MAAELKVLEADAEAIKASRQLVEQGASSIRRTTIERLAKRKPQERFEQAVAQLRRIDERRTAEEQQAEAARIAAAAERAVLAARQQFARGDHEASISALEAYRPIHPTTTKALEELRLDLERILAQRAREEEERKRREAEEAARRAEEEKERKRIEAERAATVREVAALIGKADVATADKHFDQSAALLDQALALLPESADLAVARTRLARAIEAEETRKKREQIDRLLPAIGAAIDAGSFEPARKQLSDVAALGATAAEVTPLRQRLEDAVAQHGEMTSGLTALTNALDTAAASNNAAARIVVLDKALATTVNREPTARAALKLWPGYQDAVRRARDLREQASVLEAQRAIEETLAKRSRTGRLPSKALRKADRALRQAEIDFPNAPVWPSLREQMEALRSARAAEPTFVDTTLQRIRRIPSRAALALAVVLLAAVGVGVWRTWPSPPTPPGKEESLPTPPAGPSLLDRARAALAAGRPDEALDLGLQALDADSRDPGTIQFLTDLRSAAATAAAVARDKAAGAGASSRPDFTTAQQKLMDALALMAPRQTGDAIRMFGEAADLYRSAEAGASTPAEILALAQGESREGRTDGAVSYALRGLKQYPGDSGLTGFLGSLRRAASDKVGSARDAARKAGAGLPEGGAVAIKTYQSGVGQESVAARLGTQQTAEALTALKDAEALYRKAEQEAGNFKIAEANRRLAEATKLGAEIEQSLNSAANDLKAGKFDEAAKTVAGVLQKDPKNLRAQGLQQQISEARERDRVAANSAESRQRAIGLVNQARLTRGQRGIDLLREAQDADPTNADIGPLRQELQAEVAKPKTPAPPPVNDEELIRQALLQYAAAMRSMNPDNVLAITTAHTRAFLERQFKSVDAFIFQLPPNARITRDGNSARVQFAAPLQTGGGRQNNVTFEFVLARSGNIWRIESVTFR